MTDEQAIQLLRAIREHSSLELDSIRDAAEYGADTGFGGFTYTTDGADFTRANRQLIWTLLADDADQYECSNVAEYVGTFQRADMADTEDGFDCLLAWYALETAGRWLLDRRESHV